VRNLGIVGGIGPESTVEYYRMIIASYREKVQDGSYPTILINSINMTKMLDLIGESDLIGVVEYLSGEVSKLASAKAEIGLLASNTPHIVFDEINKHSPIPLISIVDATCAAVRAVQLDKIGLIGTRFTMQGGFYSKEFSRQGIALAVPRLDEQEYIHNKYMKELVVGKIIPETRIQILKIVDRMLEEDTIQGLILGGTELPLILKEAEYHGIPFFDTTKIHVENAVAQMLL
jgi:aspartate racemase